MKKIFFVVLTLIIGFNMNVYALNSNNAEQLLSETVKYYKTITYRNWDDLYYTNSINTITDNVNNNSTSYEITEEEYNSALEANNPNDTVIETTYKKMTTSIYSYGNRYKYKVKLHWKNMPSKRSYDIIGIGFPSSVKADSAPVFENKYCTSSTSCNTATGYSYKYMGSHGAGVTFQVPTGTIVSLDQTMNVTIGKNTTSTITRQYAYGDYSHATKSISLTNAKKYMVDTGGIELDASVFSYYDDIPTADATWTGSW